jgi:hypothetical protein
MRDIVHREYNPRGTIVVDAPFLLMASGGTAAGLIATVHAIMLWWRGRRRLPDIPGEPAM